MNVALGPGYQLRWSESIRVKRNGILSPPADRGEWR